MSQQNKESSSKSTSMDDLPVKRHTKKKSSSKTSDSDADTRKTPSQEILSEDLVSSSTTSKDSAQKTRDGENRISVSVKAKKRSPKLEGQDKKRSKKRRHNEKPLDVSIKGAESATKENLSEIDSRTRPIKRRHIEKPLDVSRKTAESATKEKDSQTKKAPQESMLKWLESPSNNKPSTTSKSLIKSKSSEDVTPKKVSIASYDKKRHCTKKISQETVSAIKENGLKSSQNIMSKWLSPSGTSKDTSSKKSSKIIDWGPDWDNEILAPEKIIHLKHENKIRRKHKKDKRTSSRSKENLSENSSQAILSGWLGSPTIKKHSQESIDVKPKTKSHKDKEKPQSHNDKEKPQSHKNKEKPSTKLMSLKALENLSQDKLRNLTMQQIFGSDTSPPEAATANRWQSKTATKENRSKPRKKREKTPLDIDDLPTFQANLPEQSESFKKYGVVIPTVKEILAERKEFSIYKALVEKAKIIPLLPNPFDSLLKEPVKPPIKLLDCKHLSLEVIKEQFFKNKTILENIKNGTQYSDKHEKFHRVNSSLPYNPSNLVFAYQQINCMANLIREEFDPKEKHLRYTFAVLIPELCLLIFMDTHKMTKEETVKYLEERPVD